MSLTPGYGETPVPDDELDVLLSSARELLGEPVTKSAVYDLEQALQNEVAERALTWILGGTLTVTDLLSDSFLRDLHSQLYGDIWAWAGVYRKRELNIGVPPEHVAVELRGSFETIHYRWEHTTDWTPRQIGAVHAEVGRIHPFADGNGRSSRLLADLVFVAKELIGNEYNTSEALFLLVFFYLLVVLPISLLGSRLERRIRHAEFGD